jgi:dinuclear metal center YbgI/SA1388 family protein
MRVKPLAEVVGYLDRELRTGEVPDYEVALNGLQLANSGSVSRIAAAVDFSADTVAGAVAGKASLLVVHHGMFWRGAQRLVGVWYARLRDAIAGDLAVYSSHIPLDIHPELGNNALLARQLELEADGTFGRYKGIDVGVMGGGNLSTTRLLERIRAFSSRYATNVVSTAFREDRRTRRWAIVTGAGADTDTLDEARERGVDTLIVGEGPHHTAVEAAEHGIVVVYAGHYATETLGVQALAARLGDNFGLPWTFVDRPTGL